MNLDERHHVAIKRLREIIFSRNTAHELFIDLTTEEISPPIMATIIANPPSLGGLSYKLMMKRDLTLSIQHSERDQFAVHISMREDNRATLTWRSVTMSSTDMPMRLRQVIWDVASEEK